MSNRPRQRASVELHASVPPYVALFRGLFLSHLDSSVIISIVLDLGAGKAGYAFNFGAWAPLTQTIAGS